MTTRVLVTGANSQLAKTINELYAQNKDAIHFVFTTKNQLDITNTKGLNEQLTRGQFDYCINCAAYTNVEKAEQETESAFKVNAEAVKQLSKACKNNNTTLIHVSTDYVFDGNKKQPYLETENTNPINAYGKSKLQGEKHIEDVMDKYFIIRTSWLYSKYGKNFLKTIISKIKENAELSITTSQRGTPTNCTSLSHFIYKILRNNFTDYGLYHFSAKGETTWYDFAKKIATYFPTYDLSKIKAVGSFKTAARRPSYSVLNTDKSKQVSTKQNTWEENLHETITSYLK